MPGLDLYLASTSPRRRALLQQAGLRFALCEPGDEYAPGSGQHEHEGGAGVPAELARERAERKARGARPPLDDAPVLAVDTVVDLDGQELSKAADRAAAGRLLGRLLGRRHLVHTAHCLRTPDGRLRHELATATVAFADPGPAALARYLDSGDWRGKAGAYGIQDPQLPFASLVDGTLDTVIGMHVAAVQRLLDAARSAS
ncbi:MAG: Maf family protein [Planctomycetes bacterium]|nr:Maf family protein [Planctomycetota bacterium]